MTVHRRSAYLPAWSGPAVCVIAAMSYPTALVSAPWVSLRSASRW
jgi:hypothetical protein